MTLTQPRQRVRNSVRVVSFAGESRAIPRAEGNLVGRSLGFVGPGHDLEQRDDQDVFC